jgi:hypothetical protein
MRIQALAAHPGLHPELLPLLPILGHTLVRMLQFQVRGERVVHVVEEVLLGLVAGAAWGTGAPLSLIALPFDNTLGSQMLAFLAGADDGVVADLWGTGAPLSLIALPFGSTMDSRMLLLPLLMLLVLLKGGPRRR